MTPNQSASARTASDNQLDALRQHSVVVADTGDLESIQAYRPTDATTNPTLILAAAGNAQASELIDETIAETSQSDPARRMDEAMTRLSVRFGREILQYIPGRVSTEVDARLSFNTRASIDKARELISLYEQAGIERERILIKLAATWEGIEAARVLEAEGIHCNMTLMFSLAQGIACAQAGATLISPFVGRIYDWYRKHEGVEDFAPEEDPGVISVRRIYTWLKKHGYETEVMGASFRKREQVVALAGCDLLTISPALLDELQSSQAPLTRQLDPETARNSDMTQVKLDEAAFRWQLNEDPMATEKLAEGIRRFAADARKLEDMLQNRGIQTS